MASTTHFDNHHGVLINVSGKGILITGQPGVGKSNLAIELLHHGHQLVADDNVEFTLDNTQRIIGRSPKVLQGLIHSRELGLFSVIDTFGSDAYLETSYLDYVIELSSEKQTSVSLEPSSLTTLICDQAIPTLVLNPKHSGSLSIQIMTWLKICSAPNDAYQLLKQRQQKFMAL